MFALRGRSPGIGLLQTQPGDAGLQLDRSTVCRAAQLLLPKQKIGLAVALIAFIRTARLHIQRSSAKREAREAYTDLLLRQQELR
ncbi:MAG: hypothetical protein AAFP04_14025, partial [Myxococcota bacterium]